LTCFQCLVLFRPARQYIPLLIVRHCAQQQQLSPHQSTDGSP
jgi:hypothetical protein